MTFDELDEGAAIFIDANIFIYHFVKSSPRCSSFLARSESRGVRGATSVLVLAEVSHRLMMIEAVERGLVSPGNVARKVGARTDLVRQLSNYELAVQAIYTMNLEIAPVTERTLLQGLRLQRRYGLLTNDSLIVATMLQSGVRLLATADRRFASVSEIETVMPSDLRTAN
jgi:predicted nucleic acid-binding protein